MSPCWFRFVLLHLLLIVSHTYQSQKNGYFRSCDPDRDNFSLDWKPGPLTAGTAYSVDLNAVAATSFAYGKTCFKIWMKSISYMIFDDCEDTLCEEVYKVARQFIDLSFTCPIKPGDIFRVSNFQYSLDPAMPLPGGLYQVNVTIDNEKKERLLCVTADVEIPEESDEDY